MSGEHGVEQRPLPMGAKRGEVLTSQFALESIGISVERNGRDQRPQVLGAALQRIAFEFGDEGVAVVERQLAALDQPRNVERELEHRIEQRGFLGALVQRLEAGEQGLYRVHGTCWRMNAATAP